MDFAGLNLSPHVLPHFVSKLILCWIASIDTLMSDTPARTHMSSANPKPLVVPELIISMALLKAMIQNFAEHTPPCGKPVAIDTCPSFPVILMWRFL